MTELRPIACDVEGTLLQSGEPSLSFDLSETIGQLRKQGEQFAAASGRQYTNLRRLFASVADQIHHVCENGSLVFSGGKILFKQTIPRAVGAPLLEIDRCEPLSAMCSLERRATLRICETSLETTLLRWTICCRFQKTMSRLRRIFQTAFRQKSPRAVSAAVRLHALGRFRLGVAGFYPDRLQQRYDAAAFAAGRGHSFGRDHRLLRQRKQYRAAAASRLTVCDADGTSRGILPVAKSIVCWMS